MTKKQLESDRKFYLGLINQSQTVFEYTYYKQKLNRINRMINKSKRDKKHDNTRSS
jgi:hypothetical protein